MNTIYQQFKEVAWFRSIIFILFGVWSFISPQAVLQWMVYLIAAYLVLMSFFNLYASFKNYRAFGGVGFEFILGVMQFVLALIVLFFALSLIRLLPMLLGLLILLSGATRFTQGLNLKRSAVASWKTVILYSILLMIAGFVIILNPFGSVLMVFRLFGVLLFLMGISDIGTLLYLRRN